MTTDIGPHSEIDVPRVSVVMSVYNGERYLRAAVKSILAQTFTNFEFIIIDDGSQDATWDILGDYAVRDQRIVLVQNEQNIGLTKSLNKGLQLARGEYIARQDADDISLPDRLDRQVSYLDRLPHIGLLGTWARLIDEDGHETGIWQSPALPGVVKWSLFFANCLVHSSVIIRRTVLAQTGGYKPDMPYAQDYDLWFRISLKTQAANLPEILVHYRVDSNSISSQRAQAQKEIVIEVIRSAVLHFLGEPVSADVALELYHVARGLPLVKTQLIQSVADLIQKLRQTYLDSAALSNIEVKLVSRDAATKLYILAVRNIWHRPRASLRIIALAARLDLWAPFYRVAPKIGSGLSDLEKYIAGLENINKCIMS